MLASGLHLAWVLWRLASIYETWTRGHSASMHLLVLYSWFLTAILGSIVGAAIVNIWRTTIIYVNEIGYDLSTNYNVFFI